jgi:hypothetical protein
MIIKFAVDDTDYDFDSDCLTVFEARLIKSQTGQGAGHFMTGIRDMDGDALAGMIYLAKRRAGEGVTWASLDDLNLVPVIESIGKRMADAAIKQLADAREDGADEPDDEPLDAA